MSNPKDPFISLHDVASALGILDSDLLEWVKQDNPEIGYDFMNRSSIRKS